MHAAIEWDEWERFTDTDRTRFSDWVKRETGWDTDDLYSVTFGEGEVVVELLEPPGPICVTVRCPVKTLPPMPPGWLDAVG